MCVGFCHRCRVVLEVVGDVCLIDAVNIAGGFVIFKRCVFIIIWGSGELGVCQCLWVVVCFGFVANLVDNFDKGGTYKLLQVHEFFWKLYAVGLGSSGGFVSGFGLVPIRNFLIQKRCSFLRKTVLKMCLDSQNYFFITLYPII